MIRANVHEIKTHFSEYLAEVEQGETVLICKRNIPIAEIHPLPPRYTELRPVGLAKSAFDIPPSFFDPLPEDILKGFDLDHT